VSSGVGTICAVHLVVEIFEEPTVNISDPRFVYSKRTDVATRFRALGWEPPERHAEELENQTRSEGALRALKRLQEEEEKSAGNVTPIGARRRA
jgi:hypothetical protein